MQRSGRLYLQDVVNAADAIAGFLGNTGLEDYRRNDFLRSAVERKFIIIGEALSQLAKIDAGLIARLPPHAPVISFRNRLVHGYAVIDDERVFLAARGSLPTLRDSAQSLIDELDRN